MAHTIEIIKNKKYWYFNACELFERIGKVGVEIIDETKHKAKIIYVKTDINHVGEGIATKLIKMVLHELKNYEISLNVVPQPRKTENKKYTTVNGLISFYSKFGFELTDDPCVPTMVKKVNRI